MPVVRSLCINDPFDDKVYDPLYQYQFLCGDAILVVPVTSSEQVKKFYLPGGTWYDLFSDEIYHGQQELSRECRIYEVPLFVRSSSVIPMHKLVQNTKENPGDTLFIHFYHGDIQHTFTYYEDDGISMDYRQGDYYKREINFDPQMHQIRFGKKEGNYSSSFKTVRCIFHGFNNLLSTLTLNGAKVQLIDDESRMLDGLRYLDKIYDPSYFRLLRSQEKSEPRKAIVFPHADEQMILSWKPQ
jgi:alpha-glucosidase